MEEVRSFGYICPKCGKAVLGSRSAFALQAAAARISCECGESELEIQTDGCGFPAACAAAPIRRRWTQTLS